MLERVAGRAKCLVGTHQRSRSRTSYGVIDTSVCRYCGVQMQRTPMGWTVMKR